MKKIVGTLALLLASSAYATPEVYLDPGEPGETDKTSNFAYAVKGTSTPFRWAVRIKLSEFSSLTPVSVALKDITNNTTKTMTLSSSSFTDKIVHVCTLKVSGVCLYTTPVSYKVVYGTEYYSPSLDSQTYKASFSYTPTGSATKTVNTSTQTVAGMEPFCSGSGYSLGMLKSVPTGTAPSGGWPAVVLLHGGFAKDRSAKDMIAYANDLKNAGYYVINVNYRLTPDFGRFNSYFDIAHPFVEWKDFKTQNSTETLRTVEAETILSTGVHNKDTVSDVKCAVRHLRSQAAGLSINADKIAIMGWSAGAHLSMLVGLTSDSPVSDWEDKGGYNGVSTKVKAIVSMSGPTGHIAEVSAGKLPTEIKCDYRAAFRFDRGTCYENGSAPALNTLTELPVLEQYQPATYVTKTVNAGLPLLMLQGAADTLVEYNTQTIEMVNAANASSTASGKPQNAYAKIYTNGTHDHFTGGGFCSGEASAMAIAFLNAYVKGSASTTEVQTFTNALTAQSTTCN